MKNILTPGIMTPQRKVIKESLIEEDVLYFLNSLKDSFFWKNVSGGYFDGKNFRRHVSKFCLSGSSDVLGLYRGKFYALEIKTPLTIKFYEKNLDRLNSTPEFLLKSSKEKHFKRQIIFQEKIKSLGGEAYFVSSVKDVKKCLGIKM